METLLLGLSSVLLNPHRERLREAERQKGVATALRTHPVLIGPAWADDTPSDPSDDELTPKQGDQS